MRKLSALGLTLFLLAAAAPPAPITEAARAGDLPAVRELIRQGADVNAAAGDGMTALHWGAERGDAEMVRTLIAARADVARGTRIGGYTPLHVASRNGHVDAARLLLQAGADPRAVTTNSGATPLHLAASSAGGGGALVALLVDAGADVNALETSSGQTPLMFAAVAGRADVIRELMARGADPAVTTYMVDVLGAMYRDDSANDYLRAQIAALRPRNDEDWSPTPAQVQEVLREQREFAAGAYYEVKNKYTFLNDVVYGANSIALGGEAPTVRVVQPRLPLTEVQLGWTGGMTALTLAAREGHVEAVDALLDGGADIDQVTTGTHASALVTAALNGQFDAAMRLVERGADPNLKTRPTGETPLFAAVQAQWPGTPNYPQPRVFLRQKTSHLELIEALLKAGANPNVALDQHPFYWEQGRIGLDIRGATPFWRAAFARDLDAMKLLAAYGADPHQASVVNEDAMGTGRQRDARLRETSGLQPLPEGTPDMYPIHVAAGGGYLGIGASIVEGVPDGFLAAVKYLVEEQGADVNVPDAWGYAPIHYAATRGDNALVQYLVDKGADVNAMTRLGMSPVDMTLGGQRGFFPQQAQPQTEVLLRQLGSRELCRDLHFEGTGDVCPTAGTSPLEAKYGYPTTPLHLRPFSQRWGWTGWTNPEDGVRPATPPALD